MKICLYSPYVPPHTGGGEKYLFDVAQVLATRHQVVVAVSSIQPLSSEVQQQLSRTYSRFVDQPLTNLTFTATPLGTSASAWQKWWWTGQFDLIYYVTDGSLFFSRARRNILHIQVPLLLDKSTPVEQLKLKNWQVKNTNSNFTRQVVEEKWPVQINTVHHPLVELQPPTKLPAKEKIILHVGRFFRQLHTKRQDALVRFFRQLVTEQAAACRGWKLVLIGSVEDESYAAEVKNLAHGLPIEIYHQVSRQQLTNWYYKASIYWHATGFGIDQQTQPEKVEHFGISTAEAMLAGGAPVVIAKGGQPEILGPDLKEYLWETESQLLAQTLILIKNPVLLQTVQHQAQSRAKLFGRSQFEKTLWEMIGT